MKKAVAEFVKTLGFQSHYAGSNQTMHVVRSSTIPTKKTKGVTITVIELKKRITNQFGVLNFKIQ